MGELEQPAGCQHVGRAQAVSKLRRVGHVLARKRGGVPERRGAAEDRQGAGQASGTLAELGDPPQHGLRDRLRPKASYPVQRVITGPAQRGGQRFEQERVPTGGGMARLA